MQIEDFPQLVHIKKYNSIKYHLGNYLRKQKNTPEYMGLDRVENLLAGEKVELAMLCEQLMVQGNTMEAKGVFDRNELNATHFNFEGGKDKTAMA